MMTQVEKGHQGRLTRTLGWAALLYLTKMQSRLKAVYLFKWVESVDDGGKKNNSLDSNLNSVPTVEVSKGSE